MVNWLVIGIGSITRRRVIPAILAEPRSRLRGLLTRDARKAEPYTGVQAWTNLEAALQDTSVDAVYVASPVAFHAPQAIACLRAGKHVLCEKPVALNYLEAQSMVSAARENHRLLGIAYYRRLFPKLIRAKQLIASGVIGPPLLGEANFHGWVENENREWLHDPAVAGGGPLYDVGSHRIDAFNFLFGQPVRATGLLSNVVHDIPVEDSATVLVEYQNRARAIVDVRWNSHVSRDQLRVIGTEGEINLDSLSEPRIQWPGGEEHIPTHPNVHYPSVENFVGAVLDGIPLACPGEEGIWTDWVTAAVLAANPRS